MSSHDVIGTYLAELARRLPADAVDELADGLAETYQHHIRCGHAPGIAAEAAVAEFGTPTQIAAAFTRHAPGRRTANALLSTGPIVGICWGASLIAGRAWTWPIPIGVMSAFGAALAAAVALLALAATSRTDYRRTRLAALGGAGLILLDAAMLTTSALAAPTLVWPMAAALAASVVRIGLTARALPRIIAR